jgi:hypothetical protein
MQRRSLIKCILGLAAAPKILAEINFNPPMVSAVPTARLFNDLNTLWPDYMSRLIEKYGNTNWPDEMELLRKDKLQNPKLYESWS